MLAFEQSKPSLFRLFAYGTLRRGFRLHKELTRLGVRWVGTGTIRGELYDLGPYPGARPSSNEMSQITGELYHVENPELAWPALDQLEGYNFESSRTSQFVRTLATVTLDGGKSVAAHVYWLNRQPVSSRVIPSGDYANRLPA